MPKATGDGARVTAGPPLDVNDRWKKAVPDEVLGGPKPPTMKKYWTPDVAGKLITDGPPGPPRSSSQATIVKLPGNPVTAVSTVS